MALIANLISRLTIDIRVKRATLQVQALTASLVGLEAAMGNTVASLSSGALASSIAAATGRFKLVATTAATNFNAATTAINGTTAALRNASTALTATGTTMGGTANRVRAAAAGGSTVGTVGTVGRGGGAGKGGLNRGGGRPGVPPGGGFAGVAGSFVGMLVGGYALQGISSFLNRSMEMETALVQLQAITRANTQEMAAYEKKILEVAGATPFDPAQIAEGMLKLRQATGSSKAALELLGATANTALASFDKLSLPAAADFIGQISKSFGGTPAEVGERAQSIYRLSLASGTPIEHFSKVAGKLGAAAKRGGQSPETILRMFALSAGMTGGAKEAATQLERVSGEIGTQGAIEGLKQIGVVIEKTEGGIKDFGDIILQLVERWKHSPEMAKAALTKSTGGIDMTKTGSRRGAGQGIGEKSVRAILYPVVRLLEGVGGVGKGAQAWNMLGDEMKSTVDIMAILAERRLSTLNGQLQLLGEELGKTARIVGDIMAPFVRRLAGDLQALTGRFQAAYKNSKLFAWAVDNVVEVLGKAVVAFSAIAMAKGGYGLVKNVAGFTGLTGAAGWAIDRYKNRGMPSAAAQTRAMAMRGPVPAVAANALTGAALGQAMGGVGFGAASLGGKITVGALGLGLALIKLAAIAAALYVAFKALEWVAVNVWSVATRGWKGTVQKKREEKWHEIMRGEETGVKLASNQKLIKVLQPMSDSDIQAVSAEFRTKFRKSIGEASLDEMEWLGWRITNHGALLARALWASNKASIEMTKSLVDQAKATHAQVALQEKLNTAYAYGFTRMNKLMEEAKGMASYVPPEIKWGTHKKGEALLQAALGRGDLGDAEQRLVMSALNIGQQMQPLVESSVAGNISTEDHATLTRLAELWQIAFTQLARQRVGGFSLDFAGKYGADVLSQITAIGTEQNRHYSRGLGALTHGQFLDRANPAMFIPGWDQSALGYQPIPGWSDVLQGPWNRQYTNPTVDPKTGRPIGARTSENDYDYNWLSPTNTDYSTGQSRLPQAQKSERTSFLTEQSAFMERAMCRALQTVFKVPSPTARSLALEWENLPRAESSTPAPAWAKDPMSRAQDGGEYHKWGPQ